MPSCCIDVLIDTKDSFTALKSPLIPVSSSLMGTSELSKVSLIPLISSLSSESLEQADCLTRQVLGWFHAEPRVRSEKVISSSENFIAFQSQFIGFVAIFQQDSQLVYILSCV